LIIPGESKFSSTGYFSREWSPCFPAHTVDWAVFEQPRAAGGVADRTSWAFNVAGHLGRISAARTGAGGGGGGGAARAGARLTLEAVAHDYQNVTQWCVHCRPAYPLAASASFIHHVCILVMLNHHHRCISCVQADTRWQGGAADKRWQGGVVDKRWRRQWWWTRGSSRRRVPSLQRPVVQVWDGWRWATAGRHRFCGGGGGGGAGDGREEQGGRSPRSARGLSDAY
jgi:hypothetical protein